ncbi:MAG TPA: DUF4339 domain-containing protein [Kiritimatiellia bacterium]|nr:DUF4339 domain-containing protein [Kiritimatiellia bacterium]HPR68935.1 DUF4339 domain-containing protein [Kiritimatiellia bacterium]
MASWYYVIAKTREKSGPHDEAFVRARFIAGDIAPATLVWHDGLANWIPAGDAFAALQAPSGSEGKVPLPDSLRPWMAFVGVMTILLSIPPALMLYGIPMLLAGCATLGARAALGRAPFVSPDLIPFFSRLKTLFACWGWMYIIGLFLTVLGLLVYAAVAIWTLSGGQGFFPGTPAP